MTLDIALCADRMAYLGLHGTISSLVQRNSQPVRIHLVTFGLLEDELKDLVGIVEGHGSSLRIVPFKMEGFGGWRKISSSLFTYARLFLGRLLPEVDRVLYLDSDLLVHADVTQLFSLDLDGRLLAAFTGGETQYTNDWPFMKGEGIRGETPYFNAGVYLMDLELWRRQDVLTQCLEFGCKHRDAIKGADQTLLNWVVRGNHIPLANHWNQLVPPGASLPPDADGQEAIFHFFGQPKPWDWLGRRIHPWFPFWKQASAGHDLDFSRYDRFSIRQNTKNLFRFAWRNVLRR